jgi:hypothetical protein
MMNQIWPFIKYSLVISIICFSGCNFQKEKPTISKLDENTKFGDLLDFKQIDSIKILNNNGEHLLEKNLYQTLFSELGEMTYEPSIMVKTGMKSIYLFFDGESYLISGSTHGEYVEVPAGLLNKDTFFFHNHVESVYFKTNKLNIDNY